MEPPAQPPGFRFLEQGLAASPNLGQTCSNPSALRPAARTFSCITPWHVRRGMWGSLQPGHIPTIPHSLRNKAQPCVCSHSQGFLESQLIFLYRRQTLAVGPAQSAREDLRQHFPNHTAPCSGGLCTVPLSWRPCLLSTLCFLWPAWQSGTSRENGLSMLLPQKRPNKMFG